MSLSKAIFNKALLDLNIEDIKAFFTVEQEETSILEFKSGKSSLEDIHKEVCAFLNTEGGILILGAPTESPHKTEKGRKLCIGDLSPCGYNQDTLMRSIYSNIIPSPTGIKVKGLEVPSGKVYVIEVPQSFNPPHQVSEQGRYYIRLDRDAKPAPHGFVEALFFRRQKPNLISKISAYTMNGNRVNIEFRLLNDSMVSAEKLGYFIHIHGVKKLIKAASKASQPQLNDEELKEESVDRSQMLVRGLNVNLRYEIEPIDTELYVELSYYCKDVAVLTKNGIFNVKQSKFTHSSLSENADLILTYDEVIQTYANNRKLKLEALLNRLINKPLSQPEQEKVWDFTDAIHFDLPASYSGFLLITDGHFVETDNHIIGLYPIDTILEIYKQAMWDEPTNFFTIGGDIENEYVINFSDEPVTFGVLDRNQRYTEVGNSFYDLLTALTP